MKKKMLIILVACFLLIYGLGSIFYNSFLVEITSRPLAGGVTYGNNIIIENFDNETEIRFGILKAPWGNNLTREVVNNENYPVEVELKVFGPIKDYVSLNPGEKFILGPGEEKEYSLIFRPKMQTKEGVYDGSLKIIKKRLLW